MANGMLSKWWNRNDGSGDALARAGLAMMAASGPSRMPVGLGQVIGAGGQEFYNARDAWRKRQVEEFAFEQAKRKAAEERAQAERYQALRNMYSPQYRALQAGGGPTPAAAGRLAQLQSQPDPRAYLSGQGLEQLAVAQAKVKPVFHDKLAKLNESYRLGQISKADYDARKALILNPKPLVSIPPSLNEFESMTNRRDQYAQQSEKFRASGNMDKARRFQDRADQLTMRITFGGKPPEAYVKSSKAVNVVRHELSALYDLIKKGASPVDFKDRARVAQRYENVKLAYAELKARGANFTDTEQAMIDRTIGGNPNDLVARLLRGDKSYLESFRVAGEAIEREAKGLLEAFTKPPVMDFKYPWQKTAPQPRAAKSGLSPNAQKYLPKR